MSHELFAVRSCIYDRSEKAAFLAASIHEKKVMSTVWW
jgi:hypothetical protein